MKKKRQKGDNFVHYAVHKKDRQAWGGQTMCAKKKVTLSFDFTKVTCPTCRDQAIWTPEQVKKVCSQPLFFCPRCDLGQLVFTDQTDNDYELSCTNCDHKERRLW